MIFDKRWRLERKLQKYKNHYKTTDFGKYFMKYVIDLYINNTISETTADYEKIINKFTTSAYYNKLYHAFFTTELEPLEEEKRVHDFSAIVYLSIFLCTLKETEKVEILSWIKPEFVDDFIRFYKLLID